LRSAGEAMRSRIGVAPELWPGSLNCRSFPSS
jgi:hypothetical protein